MRKIILASQSPRRKQLLEWAEIPFDIIARSTDESYPPEMPIAEVPVHIAREKARLVQEEMDEQTIVLAADTVVVLQDRIIGKPRDREDAIAILSALSGREHLVITGVIIRKGDQEVGFSDTTSVFFHELTHEQIIFYIDKYKPFDKAGAYAIQEWIGVTGIRAIKGDFYNVMGLPVSRVIRALAGFE
jgi:septum formation protein